MTTHSTNVLLTELAPFLADTKSRKPSNAISSYLQQVLEKHGAQQGRIITLPALMKLARFFQTSHMEVHDALQHLRQHGYDYHLKGMDMDIPFWYTAVCDEANRSFGR
jgi:hypothetical protein